MPLKLSVGLTKKVGLPNYSSLGASCHLEVELDSHLLDHDLEGFHARVRQTFETCGQAVEDELARQGAPPDAGETAAPPANGQTSRTNGQGHPAGATAPNRMSSARPATAAQIRAIHAIADRRQVDLVGRLQAWFGVERPEELSVAQASRCIDELNLNGSGNNGRDC